MRILACLLTTVYWNFHICVYVSCNTRCCFASKRMDEWCLSLCMLSLPKLICLFDSIRSGNHHRWTRRTTPHPNQMTSTSTVRSSWSVYLNTTSVHYLVWSAPTLFDMMNFSLKLEPIWYDDEFVSLNVFDMMTLWGPNLHDMMNLQRPNLISLFNWSSTCYQLSPKIAIEGIWELLCTNEFICFFDLDATRDVYEVALSTSDEIPN